MKVHRQVLCRPNSGKWDKATAERGYSKKHNMFNSNSPPPEPANNVEWKRRLVISIEAGTVPALCNTQEVGIVYCPHLTHGRTQAQRNWAFSPNSLSWLMLGKGIPESTTSPLPWSTSIASIESVLSVDRVRVSEGMFVPREDLGSVTVPVSLCVLLLESPICRGPGRCVPPRHP